MLAPSRFVIDHARLCRVCSAAPCRIPSGAFRAPALSFRAQRQRRERFIAFLRPGLGVGLNRRRLRRRNSRRSRCCDRGGVCAWRGGGRRGRDGLCTHRHARRRIRGCVPHRVAPRRLVLFLHARRSKASFSFCTPGSFGCSVSSTSIPRSAALRSPRPAEERPALARRSPGTPAAGRPPVACRDRNGRRRSASAKKATSAAAMPSTRRLGVQRTVGPVHLAVRRRFLLPGHGARTHEADARTHLFPDRAIGRVLLRHQRVVHRVRRQRTAAAEDAPFQFQLDLRRVAAAGVLCASQVGAAEGTEALPAPASTARRSACGAPGTTCPKNQPGSPWFRIGDMLAAGGLVSFWTRFRSAPTPSEPDWPLGLSPGIRPPAGHAK